MNFEKKKSFRELLHGSIYVVRDRYPNLIADRLVQSLDWEKLTTNLNECATSEYNISSSELQAWAPEFCPQVLRKYGDFRHKKLIEFFTTYHILNPQEQHVFMDSAGGAMGYLAKLNCKEKILQDFRIREETKEALGPNVHYVEGDAGSIPLPDESVDRISCHHSFEHFQGDSDTSFLKEVQRLLAVGGKCCIVPLFIANRYAEITDRRSLKYKFDPDSTRIIDPTATIPGGLGSGDYARVYDIDAFKRRILQNIDLTRFRVSIFSLKIDGVPLPDMSLPGHRIVTGVNFPYRAFVIERAI